MKRLYVLINKELDSVYGAVQGGHAVAQYLIDTSCKKWNNEYLIYVIADLSIWKQKLEMLDINCSIFYEPDLDNMMTAIAVEHNGNLFKKLELLK